MLNEFVLKAGIKIFECHHSARGIQENYKNKCELLSFLKTRLSKHGSYCLTVSHKRPWEKWTKLLRLDLRPMIESSIHLAGNLENTKNEMTVIEHIASCATQAARVNKFLITLFT